jgi:uncharacterized membrane protein
MKNPKKIVAMLLLGVGGVDLLFGNTNHQILPDAIGNVLTQQVDLLLIAVGVYLLFY